MTIIKMRDCISFSPSIGVLVTQDILRLSDFEVRASLEMAFALNRDDLLIEASQGYGPLAEFNEMEVGKFCEMAIAIGVMRETARAKKLLTYKRRKSFNQDRDAIMLEMIDAGKEFRCAHADCLAQENLTIDHIVPLSRGGTDEISNLQFLCRSHNSIKGDKKEAVPNDPI